MTSQFMFPNFGGTLPLGYIFEFDPTGITGAPDLSTAEKVHDYFGYGVWEDYGSGRVTIGVSNTHAISTEGGEENHSLNVPELANHNHRGLSNSGYPIDSIGSNTNDGYNTKYSVCAITNFSEYGYGESYLTGLTGSGKPHNNMQPYKTVYRWRRIA